MNLVFGSTNWKVTYIEMDFKEGSKDGMYSCFVRVQCTVTIWDGINWIGDKTDTGADFKTMSVENWAQAKESCYKSAYSDALKRACRLFGEYTGNSTYKKNSKKNAAESEEAREELVQSAIAADNRAEMEKHARELEYVEHVPFSTDDEKMTNLPSLPGSPSKVSDISGSTYRTTTTTPSGGSRLKRNRSPGGTENQLNSTNSVKPTSSNPYNGSSNGIKKPKMNPYRPKASI